MFIKQFVDEGLGNSSYLIASEAAGLAAVIDPERDVDRYIQAAEGLGLRLVYSLDTHLHNDFISGSRELASMAGVQIGANTASGLAFDYHPLQDNEILTLGDLRLQVLATPGHTPEHVSYSLLEANKEVPTALFTGGALMVGGVARTDLLGEDLARPLAEQSFRSLHDRLLDFPDEVVVFPTHGAGSLCAAPSKAERTTTLGQERSGNPFVQTQTEQDYVERLLNGLPSYPTYFKYLRRINQTGPKVLGGVPLLQPLTAPEVQKAMADGVAVLDVRSPDAFASGHIPGAYGVPLDAPLAVWAGWVIPFGMPLILIAENDSEINESVRRLIRIGYDDLRGFLQSGIAAWQSENLPVKAIPVISDEELAQRLQRGNAPWIVDVRSDAEWQAGHIPHAIHIESGQLPFMNLNLPKDVVKVIHCGHADRSTVSISILEQRGYRNLVRLSNGFDGWEASGYEVIKE